MIAAVLLQSPAQEPKREDVLRKVDAAKVDAAIRSGCEWLLGEYEAGKLAPFEREGVKHKYEDLLLLVLAYAGHDRADARFQKILRTVVEHPPERTYDTSCAAMALVKVDKAKYQWRVAQCAQFVVDNQLPDGQWGYGVPTKVDHIRPWDPPPAKAGSTTSLKPYAVVKKGGGRADEQGDKSNSQFAAMGLRAAHDAEIRLPADTIRRGADAWEKSQNKDGGWSYRPKDGPASYGSMTAGGMSSLAIYDFLSGSAARLDPRCERARRWVAENWVVDANPKGTMGNRYYWLYAVERAGTLFGTELMGAHEWYPEGAGHILAQQRGDKSWDQDVSKTAFAILFLRRVTDDYRPPVATGKK